MEGGILTDFFNCSPIIEKLKANPIEKEIAGKIIGNKRKGCFSTK